MPMSDCIEPSNLRSTRVSVASGVSDTVEVCSSAPKSRSMVCVIVTPLAERASRTFSLMPIASPNWLLPMIERVFTVAWKGTPLSEVSAALSHLMIFTLLCRPT